MRLPYKPWKNMNSNNKRNPEMLLNGRLRYLKKNAYSLYKTKVKKDMSTSRKIKIAEKIHLKQLEGKIEKPSKTKTNITVNKPIKSKRDKSSFPKINSIINKSNAKNELPLSNRAKLLKATNKPKTVRKTKQNKPKVTRRITTDKKKTVDKKKKNYVEGTSEYKFYMSLMCQKPNSQMAKSWINNHGITNKLLEKYCKELHKKMN